MAVAQRLTVSQYLERDVERGCNLIDGEIVVNQPRPLHQAVLGELFSALGHWAREAPGRGAGDPAA